MEGAPRTRLPFKGPILIYGLFVLGMASVSRLVERHSAVLQGVTGVRGSDVQVDLEEGVLPSVDLGGGGDLEAQLAPFMPLAGLPLPQAALADAGAAGQIAEALGQGGVRPSPEGDEDVPGWTFLMNAEQRRAHRGPAAPHAPLEVGVRSAPIGAVGHGAPPSARPFSLDFQLIDGAGVPVAAESVRVTQQGSDGEYHPSAYPSIEGGGCWIAGSPALTPGRCALFLFEVTAADGSRWFGSTIGQAPLRGSVPLGAVELRPASE
jgi:hypothetical protein